MEKEHYLSDPDDNDSYDESGTEASDCEGDYTDNGSSDTESPKKKKKEAWHEEQEEQEEGMQHGGKFGCREREAQAVKVEEEREERKIFEEQEQERREVGQGEAREAGQAGQEAEVGQEEKALALVVGETAAENHTLPCGLQRPSAPQTGSPPSDSLPLSGPREPKSLPTEKL